jgi:presenilin-like A22 family membrane protease
MFLVVLTMVCSALVVIFVSTPEQTFTLVQTSSDDASSDNSNATKLGRSIMNGLVIVVVVCLMTFVIVLFYKFKCHKCLAGYMVMSSTMILGFLASNLSTIAIDRYQIPIDKISFYFIMYNFAITGVLSIIAPQGAVPYYLTQCYLAATSMIVAWHFAKFDPWTTWVLLILIALYDLFAVLSPYGPLRALVNLMQRDDSPMIPGLLYEANLPSSQQQQQQRQQQQQQQQRNHQNQQPSHQPPLPPPPRQETHRNSVRASSDGGDNDADGSADDELPTEDAPLLSNDRCIIREESIENDLDDDDIPSPETATTTTMEQDRQPQRQPSTAVDISVSTSNTQGPTTSHASPSSESPPIIDGHDNVGDVPGRIPLALALRYKLRFQQDPQPYWIADPDHPVTFTPAQLHQEVNVLFPHRGGRIVPTVSLHTASAAFHRRTHRRRALIDNTGVHRRVIFVTDEGRIFEDLREQQYREDQDEDAKERTSIKLGLGDFIFYSILVSKAALYSFTAFGACLVAIVSGLGLTLLLLAMHGQALPALPISIFMGVFFYLTTRFCLEPYIHDIFEAGVLVG